VGAIRHLLAQRPLAALIVAAALALKLLVPAGYMVGSEGGRVTVSICSGTGPSTMVVELPEVGDEAGHGKDHGDGGKEMPCVFSGLSAPALAATDPIQLAALIAFVLAIGLLPSAPPLPTRAAHLRPPSHGPPVRP
jgi:hypothetical protein